MIEAPLFTAAGARSASGFALPGDYFDGTVNEPVLHRAVVAHLNNQRQGTAATKTRSFVSGGNQKPWKQKGTGRARQGSTRAPHWRGGGVVFGPHPKDYRTELPRKVRQLARRSALNARAREGSLMVIERFGFDAPKTAQLAEILGKLGHDGRKMLVLTRTTDRNVYLSGRNMQSVQVMPYAEASAYDVLWADVVVVEQGAFGTDEPVMAAEGEETAPAPARKRTAKSAKAGKAAKKSAGTAARKGAPKKAAKSSATKRQAKAATKPAKKAAKPAAKKPAAKKPARKKKETD